jgi:hypothetical protein
MVHGGRDARRPGIRVPEERGSFTARRVEDREQIADAVVQRRHVRQTIGEPQAPRVHQDEPREARQAGQETFDPRFLPEHLDMGHRPRDEQEIRSGTRRAHHLIGERGPVVPRVRRLLVRHLVHRLPSEATDASAARTIRGVSRAAASATAASPQR